MGRRPASEARVTRAAPPHPALTRIGLALGMPLMRFLFWLLRRFHERRALSIARAISRVLAVPTMAARRRAQEAVFAARSNGARRGLERAHIDYLSRLRVHGARLPLETPESIRYGVTLDGEEHLLKARDGHRGVIVVGGHVGSWLHILPALACRGHPLLFLVNPALPRLTTYLEAISSRHGFALAGVGDSAQDAAGRHLRGGGVLYLTIDATVHPDRSVWLRFGPSELLVDPGPAVLALRHRRPVIWATTYHDDTGGSRVLLAPPMEVGPGTPWTRSGPLMQHWLDLLWSDVSRRPAQWWPIAYVPIRLPSAVAPDATVSTS